MSRTPTHADRTPPPPPPPPPGASLLRVLIVCPSWLGDAVMATPAIRLLRERLPGAFLGGLVRPGIDEVYAGSGLLDEAHVERASGVMGPKFAAAKVRPRRYDAALLLTNSFSTALITRIAGIPRRIGYDRDARGLLLTDRLGAPRRREGEPGAGRWAIVPAVDYYWHAARELLVRHAGLRDVPESPVGRALELGVTPDEERRAAALLARAGVGPGEGFALLNPGGNKPEKRWPAERFAHVGRHLRGAHGLRVLVSGSPGERDLCSGIARDADAVDLTALGVTIGALKGLCAARDGRGVPVCRVMVTNDTGPRHVAAALGVRVVSLFGPTDHRWTIIPTRPDAPEAVLTADPTLPGHESANDHPERCRIDRIELARVLGACDALLGVPGAHA